MSKRMRQYGMAFLLCVVMMLGNGMTAFAFADESTAQEETEAVVVVEENITEEQEEEADGEGVLTPDGNLSLVDDLDEEAGKDLQYMTVQTKSGNYFYIIIDRSSDEDNVYFLNMVDEADLMALMSDDEIAAITPETEEQEPVEEEPIEEEPIEEEPVKTDETETEALEEPEHESNIVLYILIAVIAVGTIGGYYFLKIKPMKDGSGNDEDMEFYDDEEYENEDETPGESEDDGIEFIDLDDSPDKEE